MGMKAPSKRRIPGSDEWTEATAFAKKMYETEREYLDLVMPWDSLSSDKREARIRAALVHVVPANKKERERRIDSLVERVRERKGDYLVALDHLADFARGTC